MADGIRRVGSGFGVGAAVASETGVEFGGVGAGVDLRTGSRVDGDGVGVGEGVLIGPDGWIVGVPIGVGCEDSEGSGPVPEQDTESRVPIVSAMATCFNSFSAEVQALATPAKGSFPSTKCGLAGCHPRPY